MASLTLTVDDAIIDRLRTAYSVSTNAQLRTAIINQIKQHVVSYERQQVVQAEAAKVQAAQETARTNEKAAITKAESEITLS